LKLLYCIGAGLGNIIQTLPALRTLIEVGKHQTDVFICNGFTNNDISVIFEKYADSVFFRLDDINLKKYDGCIVNRSGDLFYHKNSKIKILKKLNINKSLTEKYKRSEVDINLDTCRDLGIEEKDFLWTVDFDFKDNNMPSYDIVVCNGYTVNDNKYPYWRYKQFFYYNELIKKLLKKYTVASVGIDQSAFQGTKDYLGLSLMDTMKLIQKSKLFINNDSGLYHVANVLKKRNIVFFTFTSKIKNYEPRFHKYSIVMERDDLKCRKDCQQKNLVKKCFFNYECTKIPLNDVINKINQLMGEN